MLRTKDVAGFLRPLAAARRARCTPSPSPASRRRSPPRKPPPPPAPPAFRTRRPPETVAEAVADIAATAPGSRILICGSLYLAGRVLRENG